MSATYTLTMDAETANVVKRACELYARILFGQWDEISWEMTMRDSTFIDRRNDCQRHLAEAKTATFPELPPGQSYGVGHDRTADTAWNAYQAIRYAIAWHDHPEGGCTVNFDKPLRVSDAPMPKCEVKKDE
jgi:hypothetical protein